jgi:hypothetical protein
MTGKRSLSGVKDFHPLDLDSPRELRLIRNSASVQGAAPARTPSPSNMATDAAHS